MYLKIASAPGISPDGSGHYVIPTARCNSGGFQFAFGVQDNAPIISDTYPTTIDWAWTLTLRNSGGTALVSYSATARTTVTVFGGAGTVTILTSSSTVTPMGAVSGDGLSGTENVSGGAVSATFYSHVWNVVVPVGAYFTVDAFSATASYAGASAQQRSTHNAYTASKPVASFTVSASVDVATVNAAATTMESPPGNSHSDYFPLTYAYDWGDGEISSQSGSPTTGGNTTHTYGDNDTFTITETVTDQYGGTDSTTRTVTITDAPLLFGSFVDETGALFSAVNSSTSVQTKTFASGSTSATNRATVSNAKFADYKKALRGIRQYLLVHDRTSGDAVLRTSDDNGRTVS